MSFKVEVKGLRELQAKIDSLPRRLKTQGNAIVQRGAEIFVRGAKRDVPRNFGASGLAGAITFYPNPVTNLKVSVVAQKNYAAYPEWGTITRVKVPAAEQSYAIQFKGRGIRKNGGLYPTPYFFPQIPFAVAAIEQGFKALMRDEKL